MAHFVIPYCAFLPGIFIAIISFHFEIIPLKLLLTLGESRGQVPFPPFVEAIIMEITLEMLFHLKNCQNIMSILSGMGFTPGHISIPYTRKRRPTGEKNYPEHILTWKLIFESAPLEQ
jgi:hypothetical protein